MNIIANKPRQINIIAMKIKSFIDTKGLKCLTHIVNGTRRKVIIMLRLIFLLNFFVIIVTKIKNNDKKIRNIE